VPASHEMTVKVRWSEADPAGIVFYPRFFEWFGLATEALFESRFAVAGHLPQYRTSACRSESGARFTSPVRYGDRVRVRSEVTGSARARSAWPTTSGGNRRLRERVRGPGGWRCRRPGARPVRARCPRSRPDASAARPRAGTA
jgi:hypothetical protein